MRIRSLFLSLIFASFLSFVTILILFVYFIKNSQETQNNGMFNRYEIIRSIMLNSRRNVSSYEFDHNLRQFNMNIIFNIHKKISILKHSTLLKKDKRKLVTQTFLAIPQLFVARKEIHLNISMLKYKRKIYFRLRTPINDILIIDKTLKPYSYLVGAYPFITIIIVLIIIFSFILFKIYPLRRISQGIAKFGDGDLNIRLDFKGNNELAEIADSFNKSVQQIKALINGRTLFMRNVMHELKTPIAKGRLLCGLLEQKHERDRFDKVFIRLQKLIDDFALLDQVKSNVNIITSETYNMRDIVDEAVEIGFYESTEVCIQEERIIKKSIDYNLFVIVVKNLIDNGIKYSSNSYVKIIIKRREIKFISKGEALEKPLTYYLSAFTGKKRNNSFGLGLYIVNEIVKRHDMTLGYEYENEQNIFIINC